MSTQALERLALRASPGLHPRFHSTTCGAERIELARAGARVGFAKFAGPIARVPLLASARIALRQSARLVTEAFGGAGFGS